MAHDFHNVTSVTFTGIAGASTDAAFALDNIFVAAVVPELATGIPLLAALSTTMSIAWRRRAKWRAQNAKYD